MEADDKNQQIGDHTVPSTDTIYNVSNGRTISSSKNSNNIRKSEPMHDATMMPCYAQDAGDVLYSNVSDFSNAENESSEESDAVDEIGDLLQRFNTYFRNKVDNELQALGHFMHGMLSEQQIHLQQILSWSRLPPKSQSPCNSQQETTSIGFGGNEQEPLEEESPGTHLDFNERFEIAESSGKMNERAARSEILMEIMTLSCELSALLSQSKFV